MKDTVGPCPILSRFAAVVAAIGVLACGGPNDLVAPGGAPSAPGGAAAGRLEASLDPVLAVDASGHARLEDFPGTSSDRFDVEIEIADAAFGVLRISPDDGFADEKVELVTLRSGAVVFDTALAFSEDRRVGLSGDITFEVTIRGAAAPELLPGDVLEVAVNGTLLLRGILART